MKKFLSYVMTMLIISGFIFNSCQKEEKVSKAAILLTPTDATAFNANDGAISLEINGGKEPFYFFWSTGDTIQNLTDLYAGNYSVKVIYGKNGESVINGSTIVGQPDPAALDIQFSVTDVQHYGNPEGKLSVDVAGGTPPYSVLWNNGDTVTSIENLYAGEYSIVITDNSSPFKITSSATAVVGQPEFVCGIDSVTDIDGNKYSTVQLGNQCWMSENLRTMHDPANKDSLVLIEGRSCYGLYCSGIEGAHYTWEAMMAGSSAVPENANQEVQGICPDGWHIPSKPEFDELDAWLKIDGNGGPGKLSGEKIKGSDSSSGFDALLIGNFGYNVYQSAASASFWTSTIYSVDESQGRIIFVTSDLPLINKGPRPKNYGLSVRCIKNSE